ncbi:MAG: hypothetical protein CMH46_16310 [Muricauda sp.]|jgi:uncharacterized membrane protein HdeD (DUF308 family)|nr:DUF308 domain-containing protein [Allomuricauda sp.]MAU17092.1 hypothetical protein [Allomuricauda sp.]|tara:strand:- start:13324 stop:13866 length:543 start_codon:yes stop_codon:yes gene_type:complete
MEKSIINKWWMPVLLGTVIFIASIIIVTRPTEAFLGLALIMGWFILFSGIMNIIFSVQNRKVFDDWIWYLLLGIIETLLGTALLLRPQMSVNALILFAGFWMIFLAVSRISSAFLLKKMKTSMWWLPLVSGILIFIFSFLMLLNPLIAVFSLIYLTAIPLMIYGAMAIYFGFKIRQYNKS